MKRFCLFLVAALMLSLFSSCGAKRVSPEEVAELREEYPFHNELPATMDFDFQEGKPLQFFWERGDFSWAAVVEITGNVFAEPSAQFPSLELKYLPAKITRFLVGKSELKVGKEILLRCGGAFSRETMRAYQFGQQYVVFMGDAGGVKGLEDSYGALPMHSFYLTEEQVVLPMASLFTWMKDYEGMYLDDFAKAITEEYDKAQAAIQARDSES